MKPGKQGQKPPQLQQDQRSNGERMEGHPQKLTFWEEAYHQWGPPVFAFLVNRLGHRADAEDLLQETFVRAIRSRHNLREPEKVKSYLFTIAHNLMVNHVRKNRPEAVSDTANPDGLTVLDTTADEESTPPDLAAEAEDLHGMVSQHLETMKEQYRVAFELGVLQGRAYSDIARTTGWSLAQVKINVYRARKQMIGHLADKGYLDLEPQR